MGGSEGREYISGYEGQGRSYTFLHAQLTLAAPVLAVIFKCCGPEVGHGLRTFHRKQAA